MIPLTGVGIPGFRGDDWYRERIEIFKQTTLKSLLNQENRNFILWITCRPEEMIKMETFNLGSYLRSLGVKYMFTFNSLPYWDDKFSHDPWSRLKNLARMIRWGWRNRTWKLGLGQVFVDKNKTLAWRLRQSLKSLQDRFGYADWVYLTRLDSDDMFHKSAVREIQEQEPHIEALVYKNGYIFNGSNGDVAEYVPKTNPPFHTIIFPGDIFFDAKKHLNYYGDFRSHEDIPNLFKVKTMSDGRYCVGINNPYLHISTLWNHPYRGKVVSTNTMKDFGL